MILPKYEGDVIKINGICYQYVGDTLTPPDTDPATIQATYGDCITCQGSSSSAGDPVPSSCPGGLAASYTVNVSAINFRVWNSLDGCSNEDPADDTCTTAPSSFSVSGSSCTWTSAAFESLCTGTSLSGVITAHSLTLDTANSRWVLELQWANNSCVNGGEYTSTHYKYTGGTPEGAYEDADTGCRVGGVCSDQMIVTGVTIT